MTGMAATTGYATRRERRRTLRRGRRLLACAVVCMLLGLLPLSAILALQGWNAHKQSDAASEVEATQESWPLTRQDDMIAQAERYNRRLADSGQPTIGSLPDPDTGEADFAAKADTEYWSLLSGAQNVMGTIRIPSIGVHLSIRHGSDESALANGAGHLYGTSLPVGGEGTHTVITAHRGVPDKELFTRLDELEKGDVFYLTVAGHTLAYKVTRIREADPDDTSMVRVEPGEDLATLLTCTPYGVNTRRLLVTGTRVGMPDDAPEPDDAPRDAKPLLVGLGAALTVLLIGCVIIPDRRTVEGLHVNRRP